MICKGLARFGGYVRIPKTYGEYGDHGHEEEELPIDYEMRSVEGVHDLYIGEDFDPSEIIPDSYHRIEYLGVNGYNEPFAWDDKNSGAWEQGVSLDNNVWVEDAYLVEAANPNTFVASEDARDNEVRAQYFRLYDENDEVICDYVFRTYTILREKEKPWFVKFDYEGFAARDEDGWVQYIFDPFGTGARGSLTMYSNSYDPNFKGNLFDISPENTDHWRGYNRWTGEQYTFADYAEKVSEITVADWQEGSYEGDPLAVVCSPTIEADGSYEYVGACTQTHLFHNGLVTVTDGVNSREYVLSQRQFAT